MLYFWHMLEKSFIISLFFIYSPFFLLLKYENNHNKYWISYVTIFCEAITTWATSFNFDSLEVDTYSLIRDALYTGFVTYILIETPLLTWYLQKKSINSSIQNVLKHHYPRFKLVAILCANHLVIKHFLAMAAQITHSAHENTTLIVTCSKKPGGQASLFACLHQHNCT